MKLPEIECTFGQSQLGQMELEDSHRSAHGINPRLGAGAVLILAVILSFGLGWSIWAALRSFLAIVLKSD